MLFNRVIRAQIVSGSASLDIAGLNMEFTVEKTTKTSSNTCQLRIYNLSDDTASQINERDDELLLFAGYERESGSELIYRGNITLITDKNEQPNRITTLECGDGEIALRETRVSLTFEEQVDGRTVLVEIAKQLKITIRSFYPGEYKMYQQGFSFVGLAKEALDRVTDFLGLEWSIQNGELQIMYRRGVTDVSAIRVAYDTGLIELPYNNRNQENDLTGDRKKPGWKFRTLLNPKFEPGGIVNLDTEVVTGLFRIETVKHDGALFSQQFTSELEVIEYFLPERVNKNQIKVKS